MNVKTLGWYQRLARDYVTSTRASTRQPGAFDEVGAYAMFVGHARSGSTLVGSLLSAHPDAVLAHELDALRYVRSGLSRDQLFHLILASDRAFTGDHASKTQQGYAFAVPGMWQGRHRRLRLVGDKHAGTSTRALVSRPELLSKLAAVVAVPVRLVHVVRNPWDNIATIAKRSERSLETASASYFRRCQTIQSIKTRITSGPGIAGDVSLSHVHHESFTADPTTDLARLCRFLGLDAESDYLAACASIVFETPHRTRAEASWPQGLVDGIGQQASRFDFLSSYTFDH